MRAAAVAVALLSTRAALADADAIEPARSPPLQLIASAFVGDGLRFNDPYRLSTPLGSTAESVSRTSAYSDLGLAVTFGDPRGLQHGVAARLSLAAEGVPQGVLAPGYLAYWRPHPAWAAYGRLALPVVLTPTVTWGLEASVGSVYYVRAGLGVAAEVVGDLFYGAATRDVRAAAYPVLSAQLGFVIAYEVLP